MRAEKNCSPYPLLKKQKQVIKLLFPVTLHQLGQFVFLLLMYLAKTRTNRKKRRLSQLGNPLDGMEDVYVYEVKGQDREGERKPDGSRGEKRRGGEA